MLKNKCTVLERSGRSVMSKLYKDFDADLTLMSKYKTTMD